MSFLFAPTNLLLIRVPIPGWITVDAKFMVPVKKANIVPSILAGVIFANSASIGKEYNTV